MSGPEQVHEKRPSLRELCTGALSFSQLYLLCAAVLVLANARVFYGSLRMQTEHVELWFHPENFQAIFQGTQTGAWSAPLDDVFIHFDFARATAQGYPFEWIAGNGYSSGGTSLLYPFVLSLGVLLGSEGLSLTHFAGTVACVSTFAALLGARRMFKNLPEWTSLLAPPALLCIGALNWTLFSGMEVALFLALWALCVVVWDDLLTAIDDGTATRSLALGLGGVSALLVSCRPEAAPLVGYFGLTSAFALYRSRGRNSALWTLFLVGTPGALIVIAHMVTNKILTGDSAAAGALAKLEMHHPYLTGDQVWDSWIFYLKYQFLRLSDYHFSSLPLVGYLIWPLALLSACFKKTRRYGVMLLCAIVLWAALVATNGQVRWQNERYTMPAVAWLLLAAALGIAGCLDWALAEARSRRAKVFTLVPLTLAVVLFLTGQAERFRDQVWFFGRASRNILEQHVRAAESLRHSNRAHRRVLISDAGAIPYMSGLPAIDLIGLGGYGRLPIAKASRQGVGAALELFEYIPNEDLPDVMALYPSWWGDFVLWFGTKVDDFPVRGNVICGGASKVIYKPRWDALFHSADPFSLTEEERLVDSVDFADVINEAAHGVSWNREAQGYVGMKLLPDPRNPRRDLWDGGRLLSTHMSFSFSLSGFGDGKASVLLRVAPFKAARLELVPPSEKPLLFDIEPGDEWQEIRIALPEGTKNGTYSLTAKEGNLHVFHLFAVEAP